MSRTPHTRIACTLGGLAVVGILGGCTTMSSFFGSSSTTVAFTNVADTALDVSFYVEDTMNESDGEFVGSGTFQIDRGGSKDYKLTRHPNWATNRDATVHIAVSPVTPSWESTTTTYWLELLTDPPVSIVATGSADDITFNTGTGQIALIPAHEIDAGRFQHRIVSAPDNASTNGN